MIYPYITQWFHAYISHFGAWVGFSLAATVYKDGVPEPKKLFSLLRAIVMVALIGSLFSSHSQTHYMTHFTSNKSGNSWTKDR